MRWRAPAFGIIGQDAEIRRGRAQPFHQPRQQIAIGIEQGGRRPRRSGLDDLVAGREYRDANATPHGELLQPHRCCERDVLGGKATARRQENGSGAHVFAGEPAVGAALESRWYDHRIAFDAHVLLHEDRIGSRRYRRPGEDADSLAAREGASRRWPAVTRSTIASRVSRPVSRSACRTAYPSTAALSNGGRSIGAMRSAARIRPGAALSAMALDLGYRAYPLIDDAFGFIDREQRA